MRVHNTYVLVESPDTYEPEHEHMGSHRTIIMKYVSVATRFARETRLMSSLVLPPSKWWFYCLTMWLTVGMSRSALWLQSGTKRAPSPSGRSGCRCVQVVKPSEGSLWIWASQNKLNWMHFLLCTFPKALIFALKRKSKKNTTKSIVGVKLLEPFRCFYVGGQKETFWGTWWYSSDWKTSFPDGNLLCSNRWVYEDNRYTAHAPGDAGALWRSWLSTQRDPSVPTEFHNNTQYMSLWRVLFSLTGMSTSHIFCHKTVLKIHKETQIVTNTYSASTIIQYRAALVQELRWTSSASTTRRPALGSWWLSLAVCIIPFKQSAADQNPLHQSWYRSPIFRTVTSLHSSSDGASITPPSTPPPHSGSERPRVFRDSVTTLWVHGQYLENKATTLQDCWFWIYIMDIGDIITKIIMLKI